MRKLHVSQCLMMVVLLGGSFLCKADSNEVPIQDEPAASLWNAGGVNVGTECSVTDSSQPTPEGQSAITLHYQLAGVDGQQTYAEYVYKGTATSSVVPTQFSAWVYGDGSQCFLIARFWDGANETHQWIIGKLDWEGWKKVTCDLAANQPGYVHFSNDGHDDPAKAEMQAPVRFQSLVIDKRFPGDQASGDIQIGAMSMSTQ